MNKLVIALAIFLLTAGICSADNYLGGLPLTTVDEGVVSGGVYSDSYYGISGQVGGSPITIDKTFDLPSYNTIDRAMLMTTVYCGNMQTNYPGTAKITFNGVVVGDETLNVPFVYIYTPANPLWVGNDNSDFLGHGTNEPYKMVNDHVNRVTSDYMMWYDVTNLVQSSNTASVHTEKLDPTISFDGRIKLITLVVAYNDGSSKNIYYRINRGHDADSAYLDSLPD